MSFSCPHYDFASERCRRLSELCVPGRAGCVLCGKVSFLEPPKLRIRRRDKRRGRLAEGDGQVQNG